MKRRPLSLVLVLAVIAALVAVVVRRVDGPSMPPGEVQLRGGERVAGEAFEVSADGRVVVEASGSQSGNGVLEATAWILDRATRRVVWRMSSGGSRPSTGTRRLQTDTLRLPAGTYEAYVSGVGMTPRQGGGLARMTDRGQTWRNDRDLWYLVVRALPGTLVARTDLDGPAPADLVFSTAPQTRENRTTRLDVSRAAAVRVVFVASEIGTASKARLTRVSDGVVVWEARAAGAVSAGGALRNRRVEATVALVPGLYDVTSEVPYDHAPTRWAQTPPDDPRSWGLTIRPASASDAGAVAEFDLWRRTPVARYEARTPDTDHVMRLSVSAPTAVVIAATGELTGPDGRYDYAWIEDASGRRVWEMSYDETEPAGGDDKNRSAEHLTTLAPGTYAVHFVTDGSHQAGAFNSDTPDHPERYGVAVFSLGAPDAVRLSGQTSRSTGDEASSDNAQNDNASGDEATPDAAAEASPSGASSDGANRGTPPPDFVEVDRQPRPTERVEPVYPAEAREAGLEGRVTVRVWVGKDGRVKDVELLRSDNDVFNENALAAVRQWRFEPARRDGEAVEVWVTIPIRFRQNRN